MMLVACGAEEATQPDAAVARPDARPDAREGLFDDGFGFGCTGNVNDTLPWTPCYTDAGFEGVCDVDVCRRWCPGTYPLHGCPNGQYGEPVVGGCVCVPRMCTRTNVAADTRDRLVGAGTVNCAVTETGL